MTLHLVGQGIRQLLFWWEVRHAVRSRPFAGLPAYPPVPNRLTEAQQRFRKLIPLKISPPIQRAGGKTGLTKLGRFDRMSSSRFAFRRCIGDGPCIPECTAAPVFAHEKWAASVYATFGSHRDLLSHRRRRQRIAERQDSVGEAAPIAGQTARVLRSASFECQGFSE
jgi:hypothetical protein